MRRINLYEVIKDIDRVLINHNKTHPIDIQFSIQGPNAYAFIFYFDSEDYISSAKRILIKLIDNLLEKYSSKYKCDLEIITLPLRQVS